MLGFYLSSHPLAEHQTTLADLLLAQHGRGRRLGHRTEVMLGGMLAAIKFSHTKNPQPGRPSRYAMFDLEDMQGVIRCILWPEQFVDYGELVQPDAILAVVGEHRQAARQRGSQPDRQRADPPGEAARAMHPRPPPPGRGRSTRPQRDRATLRDPAAAIRGSARSS